MFPQLRDQELAVAMPDQRAHVVVRHQPDGCEVSRQALVAQRIDERKEKIPGDALEPAASPRFLHPEHHVAIAFGDALMETAKKFGLFLEIAVDQKHQIAGGICEARHHRLVMTEVT